MASNLVLNSQEGGTSVTLFENETAARAGNNLVVLAYGFVRESPWDQIKYPGHPGIRAKFMGAQPVLFMVNGKITVVSPGEAAIKTARDLILGLNLAQDHYLISSSGTSPIEGVSADDGFIVTRVESTKDLGDGSGAQWRFRILLQALGV